ncbi:hypothetical protein MPTK1_1g05390 [Marchantia polymorpha subsp. ruderalis]|uniref:Uncharacterized protein n=2 Tax=Marchantia polymorpha TaxID=3197 RepID=A0AAF6ALS7_MARPO|nr:hypothetical protein MARPO_0005s0068 [Marchantia polymorpha]BBM97397.1 hypothetical protein Mp_1g05390 [Marchantia polymorpha subsp. ruderalis]|eukprot:PTQ48407.1 hypothetical protein MARPO_0005s0068 [Marchantia polymorpha]
MEGPPPSPSSSKSTDGRQISASDEFQNLTFMRQLHDSNLKKMQTLLEIHQKKVMEHEKALEEQQELVKLIRRSEFLDAHEKNKLLEDLKALSFTRGT